FRWVWACLICSLFLGSCRVLRPGGCVRDRGKAPAGVAGARRASLTRAAREWIMLGGKGRGGRGEVSGSGGAFLAGGGDQGGEAWAGGCGGSQPYLGPRGLGVAPATR